MPSSPTLGGSPETAPATAISAQEEERGSPTGLNGTTAATTTTTVTPKKKRSLASRIRQCWIKFVLLVIMGLVITEYMVVARFHFRPEPLLNLRMRQQLDDKSDYKCVGWHTTSSGWSLLTSRYQRRTLERVLRPFRHLKHLLGRPSAGCHDRIEGDELGYCELRHKTTNKRIRVFRHSTYHPPNNPFFYTRMRPYFQCSMFSAFSSYKDLILDLPASDPPLYTINSHSDNKPQGRGIIIAVYPKVLPSVYVLIKLLRQELHCQLPIELWAQGGEDGIGIHTNSMHDGALLKAILQLDENNNGNGNHKIVLKTHWDYRYEYSRSRPYSLTHSAFAEVLLLDANSFPLRDPSFLFDLPEYQSTGAIFWKDVWSPRNHPDSTIHPLLWELLGIPHDNLLRNEMEMGGGQMVIHREKCESAINLLLFFARTFTQWFLPLQLLYGDKDLYRLAWRLTNTTFHYVEQPPALMLKKHVSKSTAHQQHKDWMGTKTKTCAQTLLMANPKSGEPLFLHYKGRPFDNTTTALWEKAIVFRGGHLEKQYMVGVSWYWEDGKQPPINGIWMDEAKRCFYPKKRIRHHFKEQSFQDLVGASQLQQKLKSIAAVEKAALQFAHEALELLEKKKKLA